MKRHRLKFNASSADCILIVDGKYLVYRTQYSKNVSKLSYNNINTGLYYGFFNTILSLINKFYPMNLVIMWDGVGSVRRQEFPRYKNKDKKYLTEEQIDILEQIDAEYPNLVAMCATLGFAGYVLDGYEADDLIAVFTKKFTDINKVIISRDEDLYQLIDKTTSMYDPDRKLKKDLNWFKRTYDIEPEQWSLVKTYGGCKSDTVPGIPGVAEKTAIKIIKKDEKALKKLEKADKNELNLWSRLVTLPHNDLKNLRMPYKVTDINIELFLEMCYTYNFRSFLEKLSVFEQLT